MTETTAEHGNEIMTDLHRQVVDRGGHGPNFRLDPPVDSPDPRGDTGLTAGTYRSDN